MRGGLTDVPHGIELPFRAQLAALTNNCQRPTPRILEGPGQWSCVAVCGWVGEGVGGWWGAKVKWFLFWSDEVMLVGFAPRAMSSAGAPSRALWRPRAVAAGRGSCHHLIDEAG